MVSLTVYVFSSRNTATGFCKSEVLPLLKSQCHFVVLEVPVELFVNVVVSGEQPAGWSMLKLACNCAVAWIEINRQQGNSKRVSARRVEKASLISGGVGGFRGRKIENYGGECKGGGGGLMVKKCNVK